MNDFWTNISRYPQFFISSLIGLILVILIPFKNIIKTSPLQFLVINLILIFLYFILCNMIDL